MKTEQTNLIEGGKEKLESTVNFQKKVDEIKKEASNKYSLLLLHEKNWMKRLLLRLRLQLEIKRRIEELSSWKNLHIAKP